VGGGNLPEDKEAAWTSPLTAIWCRVYESMNFTSTLTFVCMMS
jgi:hypothetical protein